MAALGSYLLATASPAAAGGLAPDPSPAVDVRPDAYPATHVAEAVVTPTPTPTHVTEVVVVHSPAAVVPPRARPAKAAPHHRRVAPAHPRSKPKHQRPLPFPTLAVKWFSGTAVPAAGRREVPARVALVLAAFVLASAALVAGAAREAAR